MIIVSTICKDSAFKNCPLLFQNHNRFYMGQSRLKVIGQAYSSYFSRETLIIYGGRQLLVCGKTLISMKEDSC